MPEAAAESRFARFEVEIKRRGGFAFQIGVPEMSGNTGFVRAFVAGKTNVSIDSHHRSAHWARIRRERGVQFLQQWTQIGDEPQERIAHGCLVPILVGEKPVAIVVIPKVTKEAEEIWAEVPTLRHDQAAT